MDHESVERDERRAQRLVAASLVALAAYVTYDAVSTLIAAVRPAASPVGVALNTVFGFWWADPVSALVIPYFLVREAREAWQGEECDD